MHARRPRHISELEEFKNGKYFKTGSLLSCYRKCVLSAKDDVTNSAAPVKFIVFKDMSMQGRGVLN